MAATFTGSSGPFIDCFGLQPVFNVSAAELETFKLRRLAAGRAPNTVRNDLHAISVFFQYAIRQNWCSENPVRQVRLPAARVTRPFYVVSEDEEKRYFEAARSNPNLCDLARLVLLIGARPVKILRLRAMDFDRRLGNIRIRESKTASGRRTLLLPPEACSIVGRRAEGLASNAYLFAGRENGRHAVHMNNAHWARLDCSGS